MGNEHVVLLGGHRKSKKLYEEVIEEHGYKPKVFIRNVTNMSRVVGSPKAIIIFQNNVSHVMVNVAKNVAKKGDVDIYYTDNSLHSLKETLRRIQRDKNEKHRRAGKNGRK